MVVAAWVFGWYPYDPPLEVGQSGWFLFWRDAPAHLRGPEPLVLYSARAGLGDYAEATGTVIAIRHPQLGEIQSVWTGGLDYTVTLADGKELTVNADEEPGRVFEGSRVSGESCPVSATGGSLSSLTHCPS